MANNSIIFITKIGQYTDGLQCITDKMLCCAYPNRAGNWFFPNGTVVHIPHNYGLYQSRGYDGNITFNHRFSAAVSPTGLFCCRVPNARGVNQILCANIGKLLDHNDSISISVINFPVAAQINTTESFPIAGQTYSLVCDVPDAESIDHTIGYQWKKSFGSKVLPNSNQLIFSPFRLSNVGIYTCQIYSNLTNRNINVTISKNVTAQSEYTLLMK